MNEERSGKHHWVPVIAAVITASAVVIAAYVGADAKRQVKALEGQNMALEKELTVARSELQGCRAGANSTPEDNQTSGTLPQGGTGVKPTQTSEETPAPTIESNDLTREIDDIAITITRVHLSDNVLTFDFQVLNKAPGDKRMDLFGAGSFGNGSSRLIADGEEYNATSIKVGNEVWEGIVGKRFVSGVPINGYVAFRGVPRTLKSVAVLELAYSYNNLQPAGVFRFSNLTVN